MLLLKSERQKGWLIKKNLPLGQNTITTAESFLMQALRGQVLPQPTATQAKISLVKP